MNLPRHLACACALSLAAAAVAGEARRETVGPSDTILADVIEPGELDLYAFEGLRGGDVAIDVRSAPPAGWRPFFGVSDSGFSRFQRVAQVGPTAYRFEPLPSTGTFQLVMGGSGGSVGGYRVRLVVTPGRAFAASGEGEPATPPTFGALADSAVTVTLRWKGPQPVTLASLEGPDGALTSASAPVTRGTSSVQKGFRTRATGDHRAIVQVPAGTSWSMSIRVAPPRRTKGTTLDFREAGAPRLRHLTLRNVADVVSVTIPDERGGPNDLILLPRGETLQGIVLDPRNGGCAIREFDVASEGDAYEFRCLAGWYAEVRDVVRESGLIRSFTAPVVRSPSGGGSVAVEGIEYDTELRAVSWMETRTFDASGDVHVLEFRDVERGANGLITGYSVRHSVRTEQGDVLLGVVSYAPLRTP